MNTNTNIASGVIELTGTRIDLSSWIGWASWWEASLDAGTGITTALFQPVKASTKDRIERGLIFRLSMPSVIDTGEKLLEKIANARGAPRSRPASALGVGEFVLQPAGSDFQHLAGTLAIEEGDHPTDAKGDPTRYWGQHIKILAQTVSGAIIPDVRAEVRMNICMPYSLYSPENKERAISNLDGVYSCHVNGTYHELDIRVGSVIPEGFAAITRYGDPSGNNVGIDIGDRTTEIILARGFRLIARDSDGKQLGVRQVIEGVQEEFLTIYGKSIETEEVRLLLKGYTARLPLPRIRVPRGSADGYLDSATQYAIITRKILPVAKALAKFIRATLNKEGAEIGSNLDTSTIYGGGGYIFWNPLKDGIVGNPKLESAISNDPDLADGVLRDLYLPPEAEYLNASYMLEAIATQTQNTLNKGINMWERERRKG